MAIVAEGNRGRVYLPPSPEHESIAGNAALEDAPETSLPEKALGFRVQRYGMTRHQDLFTPRQLTALMTLSDLVHEVRQKIIADAGAVTDAAVYADAVCTFLGFAVDRCVDFNNALCRWTAGNEKVTNLWLMCSHRAEPGITDR